MKLLICLIGLILVVEGLPYFAFPDRMKKWMKTVHEIPDAHLRVVGLVVICIGLVLAYLFR